MSKKSFDKKVSKPVSSDVFFLKKGARRNLHPKLAILDTIDCEVYYDKKRRCLFVDYDKKNGKYKKGYYSTNFDNILKDIEDFINSVKN
jgi:hypothetical protein